MSININCPDITITREERVEKIAENFRCWITSPKLKEVIKIFDPSFDINEKESTKEILKKVKSFASENWNYREKQKEAKTVENEKARWLLKSDKIIDDNKDIILDCARELGLIGKEMLCLDEVDYILVLGGARMSNLLRPKLARKIIDEKDIEGINIVALSTMRKLADSERAGYIDTYAKDAKYEFDALSKGIEIAFEKVKDFKEEKKESSNINASIIVRKYSEKYKKNNIYVVAAPSSMPNERRANSADCFSFFFKQMNIPKGAKLLNCTSQIYCPYQQVKALCYAIKYDVVFDTVGYQPEENNKDNNNKLNMPVNYLQEIKATIDAMWDFVCEVGE